MNGHGIGSSALQAIPSSNRKEQGAMVGVAREIQHQINRSNDIACRLEQLSNRIIGSMPTTVNGGAPTGVLPEPNNFMTQMEMLLGQMQQVNGRMEELLSRLDVTF